MRLKQNLAAVLYALLLLAASWPAAAADEPPMTAMLLVARDELPDPNFADSTVLVMNNLGPAPAGVIVNRPTQISVARLFPDIKSLAGVPDKVYFGGPVELEEVWFVFRADAPRQHAIQACEGVYVSADRDLLLQLLGREKPMEGLRILIGHAGWGPGQLQGEIAQGAWRLERASAATIFNRAAEHPWPAPQTPKRGT